MIPISLSLKNFMSYRTLELDFSEIHVACLSGDNGAGKSSILDAITWCIWEEARAKREDLIRLGENEMSAELIFKVDDTKYRILRSSKKTKKTSQATLEFQIEAENGFKAITGKSITETEKKIVDAVKMSYEVFINSAFVIQGKADYFTTKKPTERKEVLASILDLKKYDDLQEKSRNKLREYQKEKELLEDMIGRAKDTFLDEENLKKSLEEKKLVLTENEIVITSALDELKQFSLEKETYNNELSVLNEIYKSFLENKKELAVIENDIEKLNYQLTENNKIIKDKEAIEEKYNELNILKKENELLSNKFVAYSELKTAGLALKSEIDEIKHKQELELQKLNDKLENINSELLKLDDILKDKQKIIDANDKYKLYKEEELNYQKKYVENNKLNTQKYEIEKNIEKELQKLKLKEAELKTKIFEKEKYTRNVSELKENLIKITEKYSELLKKEQHLENLKEDGNKLIGEIDSNKKIIELKEKEIAIINEKLEQWNHVESANCPMCNTFLDEKDKKILIDNYVKDLDSLEHEKEDLKIKNIKIIKNINSKRAEVDDLKEALKEKEPLNKKLIEYEQRIAKAEEYIKDIDELKIELNTITQKIINREVPQNLTEDLELINKKIKEINFSEEEMATITAKINDWKWSEAKFIALQNAENRYNELILVKPNLQEKRDNIQNDIDSGKYVKEKEQTIIEMREKIKTIGYSEVAHKELKTKIFNLEEYENKFHKLQQAILKIENLNSEISRLNEFKTVLNDKITINNKKIQEIPLVKSKIEIINQKISEKDYFINDKKQLVENLKIEIVKINHKLEHYETLRQNISENLDKIKLIDYEIRLYKELVTAFGKNGIQAVIIENIIPEIENIANKLLNKMTEGRMTVNFNTRKENKSNDKVSETLDIFISDELGTRNYEMYSGGEAFRVNFAIRLALSKVLAKRSGTKLKTLVIDEGFGTQDSKGLSRLIEAINSVSNDFEKILIITHMNELKEAFPTRIEVFKTIHGSEVRLLT